jgi:hypothetical protein
LPIEKSGYFYPNKGALIFLKYLEEEMGENGVSAILQIADLEEWINKYPPDDLSRAVDFAHYAAVLGALDEMYGPRSGLGIARRAGWATFENLLLQQKRFTGIRAGLIRFLPPLMKMRYGLQSLASELSQLSDQETSVQEEAAAFHFLIHRCPHCWGRQSQTPICPTATGVLEECMRWASGGNTYFVNENRCIAMGDDVCQFRVDKKTVSV